MATKLGRALISGRKFRAQTPKSSPTSCSHMKWAIMLDVMCRMKELDNIYRAALRTLSNI